jgi:uncharacterized protein YceK
MAPDNREVDGAEVVRWKKSHDLDAPVPALLDTLLFYLKLPWRPLAAHDGFALI